MFSLWASFPLNCSVQKKFCKQTQWIRMICLYLLHSWIYEQRNTASASHCANLINRPSSRIEKLALFCSRNRIERGREKCWIEAHFVRDLVHRLFMASRDERVSPCRNFYRTRVPVIWRTRRWKNLVCLVYTRQLFVTRNLSWANVSDNATELLRSGNKEQCAFFLFSFCRYGDFSRLDQPLFLIFYIQTALNFCRAYSRSLLVWKRSESQSLLSQISTLTYITSTMHTGSLFKFFHICSNKAIAFRIEVLKNFRFKFGYLVRR